MQTTSAELSNKPAVIAATGYADKVVLKVLRPETLVDPVALKYKVRMRMCRLRLIDAKGEASAAPHILLHLPGLPQSQIAVHNTAGEPITDKVLVPEDDAVSNPGTIYTPTSLTLTLEWVVLTTLFL